MTTLDKVFGIRAQPVLSYVERDAVDNRFQAAVGGDNHIVVYGSSKQGKTSLWQKHLGDKHAVIRCGEKTEPESIYRAVLRDANIRIQTIETAAKGVGGKATVRTGFKALIPFVGGAEAGAEAETNAHTESTLTWEFVGYDLSEAQSIGELLIKANFKKFIILENFHYLSDESQRQISFDLKTFHELGIRFVILGVWPEANLLLYYNGDLQDRISEIPVEPWEAADFDRICAKGCTSLNIGISNDIQSKFKNKSYRNVGLFQEFLRVLCENAGMIETQTALTSIEDEKIADLAISQKLRDQEGQLLRILQAISGKSRTRSDSDKPLILPYYLVQAILKMPIEQVKNGITKQQLQSFIQGVHYRQDPTIPRESDITNLMNQLKSHQKEMSSPFIHYNSEERLLRIVDSRHLFVLENTNRDAMFGEITNPLTVTE